MRESICICGSNSFSTILKLSSAPQGEIKFKFSSSGVYYREILRCNVCGHFISSHQMDISNLYSDDYVTSNYGDQLKATFDKINNLDPSKSDNVGRVNNIISFASNFFGKEYKPSVLDVGSGLCVFLNRVKQYGWDCTALDPDSRSAEHAKVNANVKSIHADFNKVNDSIGSYDVITFNKVLEHVPDPVFTLHKAAQYLTKKSFVYVELPDGEVAINQPNVSEEFFIDHLHVFSAASISILGAKAGFRLLKLERLQEPSGKFTLRAFFTIS